MQEALSPQLVGLQWPEGLRAQQMPHSSAHLLQQNNHLGITWKFKSSCMSQGCQLTLAPKS